MSSWTKSRGLWLMNREPRCLVWWKVSRGNVRLNGTGVSILFDRAVSGDTARTLTQDTQLNQPPFTEVDADFGGHSSITFTGNQSLATGTWNAARAVTTDYYVIRTPSASSTYYNLLDSIDGGANRHSFSYGPGAAVSIYAGAQLVSSAVATSTFAIVCAKFDGANSKIFVNNPTTPIATGNCGAQQFQALRLGNYQGTYPYIGKVALVTSFNGLDSSGLVASRMRYFARMFGRFMA